MQSKPVRTHLATASSCFDHEVLLALSDGATVSWSRLALRAQLDDDALSDAVEALVTRQSVAIVRSAQPSMVSLRITETGRRELAMRVLPRAALDGLARGIEMLARERRDGTDRRVGNPTRVTGESALRRAVRAGGAP